MYRTIKECIEIATRGIPLVARVEHEYGTVRVYKYSKTSRPVAIAEMEQLSAGKLLAILAHVANHHLLKLRIPPENVRWFVAYGEILLVMDVEWSGDRDFVIPTRIKADFRLPAELNTLLDTLLFAEEK